MKDTKIKADVILENENKDKLVLVRYKVPLNKSGRSLSVSDDAWAIVTKLSEENNVPKSTLVDLMVKFAANHIEIREV